jgi:hypothetical protein
MGFNLQANCFDLDQPIEKITFSNGVKISLLPHPLVEVCVNATNGFMGSKKDTRYYITLQDAEGYTGAKFAQDHRDAAGNVKDNLARVDKTRCSSKYCRTIEFDRGTFFSADLKTNVKLPRLIFPLTMYIDETARG